MKKFSKISIALIAAFALVAAFTYSTGYTCGGDKASTATKVNAETKSYACGSKADKAEKATAKMIDGKSHCSSSKTAMAAKDGKTCTIDGVTYEARTMNIAGMTCGGCEKSVTAALASAPGVHKVEKVCYESGTAMVWVKADKVCEKSMVKSVADKGFKAEIIPAVATSNTAGEKVCPVTGKTMKSASADKKAGCDKPCDSKTKGSKATAEAH